MPAGAATLIFAAPTLISGDANVSTQGAFDRAYNFAGSTATVNTVTFTGVAANDQSNTITFGATSDTVVSNGAVNGAGYGSGDAPYNDLSSDYKGILGEAIWNDGGPATLTLTLNGLTLGQQYLFQTWTNDSRSFGANRSGSITAGNSVILDYNNTDASGGLGQFVIGTFIADATSQVITYESNNSMINAVQLRAIPEPGSAALLGMVGVAALIRRRRLSW